MSVLTLGHSAAPAAPGARLTAGPRSGPQSLDDYLARGGYRPTGDPDALLAEVARAGVRGRGGAAFPFARKALTVRSGPAAPVVLANGEEGEPCSVKDRWLLRHRPHLVLDGIRLAAAMVGAQQAYVYLSDPQAGAAVAAAVAQSAGQGWAELEVRVHQVEPAYVAGEETAAVRAIGGGPALPTDKPPRPFEAGIDGRPTLVSNVETLACLPLVQRLGAAGFGAVGTADSPGTFLLTLTGDRTPTGLYELPYGITLRALADRLDHDFTGVAAVLMGGYFGGLLGPRALDLPLEYGALAATGSGLGCAAVALVDESRCPVEVAAAVAGYFARNTAGQCGSCFNGSAAMAAVIEGLTEHRAEAQDVERLAGWSRSLRRRGACGGLDGAANLAGSLLREFGGPVTQHLRGPCARCADRPSADRPGTDAAPYRAVEPAEPVAAGARRNG